MKNGKERMKELIETVRRDLRMSEKRRRHTEGVVGTAKLLAERHFPAEITPEEAELAALLHDYTKEYPIEKQLEICRRYGMEVPAEELETPKLLHARSASLLAEHLYGAPERICSAVRWHTTGRPAMRPLELVIYFGDYIEPGRTDPACTRLREYYERQYQSRRDKTRALYLALVRSFDTTVRFLLAERKPIDSCTVEARNDYLRLVKTANPHTGKDG